MPPPPPPEDGDLDLTLDAPPSLDDDLGIGGEIDLPSGEEEAVDASGLDMDALMSDAGAEGGLADLLEGDDAVPPPPELPAP